MCGISGIYTNSITDQHIHVVNNIMNSQSARGPDYQAMTVIKGQRGAAILAHNRLSIIDLSNNANQPMYDITGRYCIVYNGEIYNYLELKSELENAGIAFKTGSDTEVVLNAFAYWGIACLNRFHGPFAFALYDKQGEELWLCRDRFGIRPLYYIEKNDVLYFASTTPTLARSLSLEPDLEYIAQGLKYLVYENGTERTAYKNLRSLPAASYLYVKFNDTGKLTSKSKIYYNLAEKVENRIEQLSTTNTNTLLDNINQTLENAVKIRLRTDVPLAISLSSGLDSSSVAALVSRQHNNTIGFSFGHPTHRQSEGPLVAKCASFLNIDMEYVNPTPQQMIEALHKTIEIQDAPFATLSIVAQYLLYKQVRSSGVKVLLGGQGGDEAFMGYKKFLLFWLKQSIKQKDYYLTAKNFMQMIPMMFAELPSLKYYWQHRHRYLARGNADHNKQVLRLPESIKLDLGNIEQPLWKRQLQDISQFSLPTLLRYEDRNAMGNSVESRLPFMDHQLIELGLALPESVKLRAGYGKWAIRKIMTDKIPKQIRLARYKRGFDIPLVALLKSGLGESIRTQLQKHRDITGEFLQDANSIAENFSDQQLAQRQHAMAEAISLLWLNKVLV